MTVFLHHHPGLNPKALPLCAVRTTSPAEGVVRARRGIALSMQLGARRGGTWLEVLSPT